jgi:hypothetical protein
LFGCLFFIIDFKKTCPSNFLTVAKRKNARNPFKSIYLLKETILVPMPRYLSNLMDLRGRSENQINLGLFQTLAVVSLQKPLAV